MWRHPATPQHALGAGPGAIPPSGLAHLVIVMWGEYKYLADVHQDRCHREGDDTLVTEAC
jgi:hypothetical protein